MSYTLFMGLPPAPKFVSLFCMTKDKPWSIEAAAKMYPMTNERRELFMRIIDNEVEIHPIAMRLHYLSDHFNPHKLDSALKWLVKNNAVGKRFVMWFNHVCSGSDLEMVRVLNAVVDNAKLAPVIAGKNFKV